MYLLPVPQYYGLAIAAILYELLFVTLCDFCMGLIRSYITTCTLVYWYMGTTKMDYGKWYNTHTSGSS